MAEKYYGKKKCKVLKEIRKKIAEENDIEYNPIECTHEGDCAGTCPACEAELDYLNRQIEEKRKSNKKISLKGICSNIFDLMIYPWKVWQYSKQPQPFMGIITLSSSHDKDSNKTVSNEDIETDTSIIDVGDSFEKRLANFTEGDIDSPEYYYYNRNRERKEPEIEIEEKDNLILGRISSEYGPVSFTISEAKGEQKDDSESDNE